jgi:hypothetical protein
LSLLSNGAEPFVPLRHAQIGKVGESGQLPSGWRREHLETVEIHDVGSRERPWISMSLGFGAGDAGHFAGLGIAAHLPAPNAATIALAGEVTLDVWQNIGGAMLVLREARPGGDLVGQTLSSLRIHRDPQIISLSYDMTADDALIEPVLLIRRKTVDGGGLTLTLRGLAFGIVADYPRWRFGQGEGLSED